MSAIQCKSVRYNFQWHIENYCNHKKKKGEKLSSPTFKTGNGIKWRIDLYPEGCSALTENGYISLFLVNEYNVTSCAEFEFSVVNKSKSLMHTKKAVYPEHKEDWGYARFLKNEILFDPLNELLNSNTVTINLDMMVDGLFDYNTGNSELVTDLNPMSVDYMNLLNSSAMSDFTISVKNRSFKVHKLVLATRCKVFEAMLSHDTLEKQTNSLTIEDQEPDVMEAVIHYLYSGRCDKTLKMPEEVLPVADKFCLEHLKAVCESELSKQLNTENAIKILVLAETYNATDLKKKCMHFITNKCKDVLRSNEWKCLAAENKDLAFEVTLEVIDKNLLKDDTELE